VRATVVVLADAPDGECLPGLADLLAGDARARLQRLLVRRAAAWAAAAAPGRVVLAVAGGGSEGLGIELPTGIAVVASRGSSAGPGSATLVEAARAAAGSSGPVAGPGSATPVEAARAGAGGPGPLVLAGAAWPRVGAGHAAGALEDLAAGAAMVFGPALDGGAYLVALAPPLPARIELPAGPAGLPRALEAARGSGREIGLLRHERALAGPDDAAAFLADPLLAPELRAALRGA
jgi:hypothetical protein